MVWKMGCEFNVAGRIVPWPCRGVHGPGEAGLFLWRGVFVELEGVLVDGLIIAEDWLSLRVLNLMHCFSLIGI